MARSQKTLLLKQIWVWPSGPLWKSWMSWCLLFNPAQGRKSQVEARDSLVYQPSLLGELQAKRESLSQQRTWNAPIIDPPPPRHIHTQRNFEWVCILTVTSKIWFLEENFDKIDEQWRVCVVWAFLARMKGTSMSCGKICGSFSEKGILYRIDKD